MNFDGVGTKVEIAERVGKHDTIAFDLFAMVCDDASIRGAEPVAVGSVLDFNRVSLEVVRDLARGMVEAAAAGRVAVVNGEIAELGTRVRGFGGTCCYNWAAAALWVGVRGRLITGQAVRPGDAIIGLREEGFRSNGISLARRVLGDAHGDRWHESPFGDSTLGHAVLRPSRIYTPLIVSLTGGYDGEPLASVSGMVHVTGGGIPGKLRRLLEPLGHGGEVDDPFEPGDVIKHCQEAGKVADREAYRAWNMGQGLLIVTNQADVGLQQARGTGFEAKTIGRVSKTPGIRIRSRGRQSEKKEAWLEY
jgi:phosphoribosylformylglycinamidine cyclo-ligase